MITIINYGSAMFRRSPTSTSGSHPATIAKSAQDLEGASKLILPGVGAFDHAMELLDGSGMRGAIEQMVLRKAVPVLGVCVGMQILAASSEEGKLPDWAGSTGACGASTKTRCRSRLVCPIWAGMTWCRSAARTVRRLEQDSRFYFLHSYYVDCASNDNVLATSEYGIAFGCAVRSNNIYGVQFHPEKSHDYGVRLLKNFAEL